MDAPERKIAEDWVRARELSFEQAFVLDYLVHHPGAMQRDIAQMSRTGAAIVSSLLQGLERRGLVERRAPMSPSCSPLCPCSVSGMAAMFYIQ